MDKNNSILCILQNTVNFSKDTRQVIIILRQYIYVSKHVINTWKIH